MSKCLSLARVWVSHVKYVHLLMAESPIVNDKLGLALDGAFCFVLMHAYQGLLTKKSGN